MELSRNRYAIGRNICRMLAEMDCYRPNGRIDGTRHNQQWLMTQFQLRGEYVSKNTVSAWCMGNKVPTLENIVILAKILHCSVDDLITDWFCETDLAMVA